MKITTKWTIVGAGLCAWAWTATSLAPALAQVSSQGNAFLLRTKYVKGQTLKYKMTTNISGGPSKVPPMEIPMTLKVKDVKNGVATIVYTTKVPGQPKGGDIEVKVDSRGKMVGGAGLEALQGMGAMGATLPEKAVKVGDTWTQNMNSPAMQGMKMSTTYRFNGLKTVGGVKVAEIGMTIKGTGPQNMTMSGTGTMTMLASDGTMRNTSMSMDLKMQGMAMKTTTTITRG